VPSRIGVFGGTFDPPHLGHLVTAVNVRHALRLDLVLLMVAHDPWQKSRRPSAPADRLAMVEAAVRGLDGVAAGDLEVARGGPTFTADTLAELARLHPGAALFTIVGDDVAASFGEWERAGEVASGSTLVVVDRPGSPLTPPGAWRWERVEVPRLEVSSTDLRARAADGRPLDFLVPDAVRRIIAQRGLYGAPAR